MSELLCEEDIMWNGQNHYLRLYKSEIIPTLYKVSQCQAVPFTKDRQVVIYEHIDGYYGLPGGQVEDNESFETALGREILEECSCRLLDQALIGFTEDTNIDSGLITNQLRYVALVESLDLPINDPAGKSLNREIVPIKEAVKKLNWGERGNILLKLAESELIKLI